jgi:hypothetical protein
MFPAVAATAATAAVSAAATAAVSAAATAAVSAAATATVSAATAAVTDRRTGMATATARTNRRTRMTGMNDRRMSMTGMNDRRMRMTAMSAMTAAGMSAMPVMPAVATAPADAGREILTAPVPAWAVPTVVIPTIMATEPDELCALDHVQVVGRIANRSGPNHRGCTDAGAHDRCTDNENGGGNDSSKSTHDDLQCLIEFHDMSDLPSGIDVNQVNVRHLTFVQLPSLSVSSAGQ